MMRTPIALRLMLRGFAEGAARHCVEKHEATELTGEFVTQIAAGAGVKMMRLEPEIAPAEAFAAGVGFTLDFCRALGDLVYDENGQSEQH